MIQCPKCKWQPGSGGYWKCDCGHGNWNMFETGAKCPKCGKQWETTECPKCRAWSPHVDWYVDSAPQEGFAQGSQQEPEGKEGGFVSPGPYARPASPYAEFASGKDE